MSNAKPARTPTRTRTYSNPTDTDDARLIRRPELLALVGLSVSSVYERLNPRAATFDPDFPRPVKLGARAVAWRLGDVRRWNASRAAVTANDAPPPSTRA